MSLPENQQDLIERHLRRRTSAGYPDGPRAFSTAFWVAQGVVP